MAIKCYKNPASRDSYEKMLADFPNFPFTFTYDGKKHSGFGGLELLGSDEFVQGESENKAFVFKVDENLQIQFETAYYENYGAYEWTVWFENAGSGNTGVIEDVRAADMVFDGGNPVLKGILGDHKNSYAPYEYDLTERSVNFTSDNGRPTHIYFPYFNLEHGDGGTLIALGWGGTWTADFELTNGNTHFIAQSTNGMATYLKPGESIRTALMLFIPYTVRDDNYATNLWRSWFLACNLPKANAEGDDLKPISANCMSNDTGLPNSDGSISERHFTWRPSMEKMIAENARVDFRWVDAGWYTDPSGNTVPSDWWGTIGSWELDREKWPGNSLRDSTDFAREHGMKTLLWFEPERVTGVDELVKNYGYKKEWGIPFGNVIWNNIGDPGCLEWTTNRVIKILDENNIEMYREDNNSNPSESWKAGDALDGESRRGITENKGVVGHYRFWDNIIEYCGKTGKCTFVDSCASGGGRNDLESMRRGVPMLRSDADRTTTSLRLSMTTTFNKWIPFHGTSALEQVGELDGFGVMDKYVWRASYMPVLLPSVQWTQDPNTDFDMLRFGMREWNTLNHYLLKDYYVLTPWHSQHERTGWTAYCFYDEGDQSGILEAFRMEDCGVDNYTVSLPFAEENATYTLTDADSKEEKSVNGSELKHGYKLTLGAPRSAMLVYIKRNE